MLNNVVNVAWNSINALLALNVAPWNSINALLPLNVTSWNTINALLDLSRRVSLQATENMLWESQIIFNWIIFSCRPSRSSCHWRMWRSTRRKVVWSWPARPSSKADPSGSRTGRRSSPARSAAPNPAKARRSWPSSTSDPGTRENTRSDSRTGRSRPAKWPSTVSVCVCNVFLFLPKYLSTWSTVEHLNK